MLSIPPIKTFWLDTLNLRTTRLGLRLYSSDQTASDAECHRKVAKRIKKQLKVDGTGLRKELNQIGKGGRAAKANERAEQANGLVENLETLAKCFDEIGAMGARSTSDQNTNFLLVCSRVLEYAPMVGTVFVAVRPVFIAFVKMGETNVLISETSERMTQLSTGLVTLIRRVEREGISFTATEIEETEVILRAVRDGFEVVEKTMRERRSTLGKILNVDNHQEKLRGWLSATHKMLEDDQRTKVNMVYYRTRYIMETQRQYFAMLTCLSVFNIGISIGVLYLAVDIRRKLITDPFFVKWVKTLLKFDKIPLTKFNKIPATSKWPSFIKDTVPFVQNQR